VLNYTSKIRQTARQLLTNQQVDAVLGFKSGTVPMMCQPVLIRRPEDADTLCWDSFCGSNLANYLPKRQERIAIVAKGCDARNIVVHILENQTKRDKLFTMGVPCKGMVDRQKVTKAMEGKEVLEVTEGADSISAKGEGLETSFDRVDVFQDNCAICIHRNPVVYDELMGESVPEQEGIDRYRDVRKVEAMGTEERWKYFQGLVELCIRCYACRDVCPLCYCPTCFVDESRPQCGACERACPVDIKVRQFTKKLEKDVLELYGYEAGMTMETRPPLDVYQPDDPGDFIE
jgi:ferredoxin